MWGSDYPHQDSSFPNSVRIVSEHFAGVPAADQVRISRQNAIELYKLPLST
jgi:predicted TIM-barrel fold metal-dependent hydrolase